MQTTNKYPVSRSPVVGQLDKKVCAPRKGDIRVVSDDVDTSSDRSYSPASTESCSTVTSHSSDVSPKRGAFCRNTLSHDRPLDTQWPQKYAPQHDRSRRGACPDTELVDCPSCGREQLSHRRRKFSEKLKVLAKLLNYDSAWVAERIQKMEEAWSLLERESSIGAAEMKENDSSDEENTEDMLLTPASSLSSIVEGKVWEMCGSDVEASRMQSKSPPSSAKTRLASKLPLRRPYSSIDR
ncbi:hypothetical protein AMS68_001690 [Peltaster fructicola]|uniref:Uncharacterized protein n=1 Tax=Peltaster fructicola TaxID=286661 RepID=A0A6H0XN73_9PEZI|nr:hypothetical protein AMS68_001690 [Peltaster fructicola]